MLINNNGINPYKYMEKKPQSCGYGKKKVNIKRVSHFGADFQSFYKPGTAVNTFLTPEVKNCLNVIYSKDKDTMSFGKSKLKKHFKELNKF